jgi:hypothetical protein
MFTSPITNTAISGLPPDQVGVAIGVAVTGSIVAGSAGFIDSSRVAWAILGGCGLVALVLGVVSTSIWAEAAAARNGRRLATAPSPAAQGRPLPSRSPTEARK